jgi:hypothetical protein
LIIEVSVKVHRLRILVAANPGKPHGAATGVEYNLRCRFAGMPIHDEDKLMKSPFPGMDPYIEYCGLWADFHDDLVAEIKRDLAPVLPERYFVQLGERSYVVLAATNGKEERPFYPDVGVEAAEHESAPEAGGVALAEPATGNDAVTMRAFIDEHFRENFIEIYAADPGSGGQSDAGADPHGTLHAARQDPRL